MTAEELREFVRELLGGPDDAPRDLLVDSLVAHAARSRSGWKPAMPIGDVLDEVRVFAEAAFHAGGADPDQTDNYLRLGTRAFLAGEYATAREIFGTILPPLSNAEIDLGQHEIVDEVLTVEVQNCAEQYVACVYMTSPLDDRVEAIAKALTEVDGIALIWEPILMLEQTVAGPLPQFATFLPRWLQYLEGLPSTDREWDGAHDRQLREAVLQLEGAAGLERIARKFGKPGALQAWCEALAGAGDWLGLLNACSVAVEMLGTSDWRGMFLDGAAVAAKQLGHDDAVDRLETAWLGAPSMERLLRWLGAQSPDAGTVELSARRAIGACPNESGRQLGFLHLLSGDVVAAATLLTWASGLGWSNEDHPGYVLFPAFAGLLAKGTGAELAPQVYAGLDVAPWDAGGFSRLDGAGVEMAPLLEAPTVLALIETAWCSRKIDLRDRRIMLDAMRAAAAARTAKILENKRRRHYDRVAVMVACCLELAPVAEERDFVAAWFGDLRKRYSRFSAFQAELRHALDSIRVV